MNSNYANGFSLIELMIVIAIIGILIAFAIPSYQTYIRRTHYLAIIQASARYKLAISTCFELTNQLSQCQAGEHGVPQNFTNQTQHGIVEQITIGPQGVITVTPRNQYGIENTDTYVLTPQITNQGLHWQSSGGGVNKGYAT